MIVLCHHDYFAKETKKKTNLNFQSFSHKIREEKVTKNDLLVSTHTIDGLLLKQWPVLQLEYIKSNVKVERCVSGWICSSHPTLKRYHCFESR